MKKDCALVLTFIGFLYLYVSLSFLVTRTLPVPPQTISLLTKCTNEMSPPTAGWEDWCARTFFHFIWIFFPCTFSSPHFHHWFFFLPLIYFTTLEIKFLTKPICNTDLLHWFKKICIHKHEIQYKAIRGTLLSKYYPIKRCNISENKANYCFSTCSEIFITILLTVQKP